MEFIVTCKCGHVTRGYYMPIDFPIRAESAREAAHIARSIPRVKHDHKDAILNVRKVTHEEYLEQMEKNTRNPYLLCKSKKEQEEYFDSIKPFLCIDNHPEELKEERSRKKKCKHSTFSRRREEEIDFDIDSQLSNYLYEDEGDYDELYF